MTSPAARPHNGGMIKMLLLLSLLWSSSVLAAEDGPRILQSAFEQGGLVVAEVAPGTRVWVEDRELRVTPEGRFVFGFHRDDPERVRLRLRRVDGSEVRYDYTVSQREYAVQRIDGLPEGMVTPPQEVLDRINRENRRVARARSDDSAFDGFSEGFVWPTRGRISSVYGSQRILNGVPRQPHFGVDIAAPTGTPIVATASGVVRLAERDLYYTGGTIIIDHGHGVSSTYLHMSELLVAVGDEVAQGELIGKVGATGRVTGPHLCFRYNWFEKRLDPKLLLPPLDQAGS
jgi:murein DD-endopeptidase MepM/ murein hydrolase activator NlpD